MINLGYQSGEIGLLMKSNVTLQLDAGATLKAMSGAPSTVEHGHVQRRQQHEPGGAGHPGRQQGRPSGVHEGIKNICFWGGSTSSWPGSRPRTRPGTGSTSNGYPSGAGVGSPVTNVMIYGVTCTGNGRNGMSPDGLRRAGGARQRLLQPGQRQPDERDRHRADQQPGAEQLRDLQLPFTGNNGGGHPVGPGRQRRQRHLHQHDLRLQHGEQQRQLRDRGAGRGRAGEHPVQHGERHHVLVRVPGLRDHDPGQQRHQAT